jgi:hypothetical protein
VLKKMGLKEIDLTELVNVDYTEDTLSTLQINKTSPNLVGEEECYLRQYFKRFGGKTTKYWKDIEPKGKKVMIIHMVEGNFIRNADKTLEELGATDVNGAFLILNGINYMSHTAEHQLIYMEV